MRRHLLWVISAIVLVLPSAGGAQNLGLSATYGEGGLNLKLDGSYSVFSVYRAPSMEGPWEDLQRDNTNCINGCRYSDQFIQPGAVYYYRLVAADTLGVVRTYGPLAVRVPLDPLRAVLSPNPSRGSVRFSIHVPRSNLQISRLRLTIFDNSGRLIRDFGNGDYWPGQRTITWDGTDRLNHLVGSGIYFYRLQIPGAAEATGRLVRVR